MERRTMSVFLMALVLVLYIFLLPRYIAPPDTSRRILVVGDFGSGGFGEQVWSGVQDADVVTDPALKLELYQVNQHDILKYPEPWRSRSLRQQLEKELGDAPVLAIIAATSSAHTEPILQVARVFNIPVLLTVATNDSLLFPNSKASNRNALRLLPNDTKQARAMAKWVIDRSWIPKKPAGPIMLSYDDSLYGRSLFEQVRTRLNRAKVSTLSWKFGTNSRMLDLLVDAKLAKSAGIIFMGYYPEAQDLLFNARSINYDKPILLSDGAYSPELFQMHKMKISTFLSQPTAPNTTLPYNLRGFGVYGHDAYVLISEARANLKSHNQEIQDNKGPRLLARIVSVADLLRKGQLGQSKRLMGQYDFSNSPNGENVLADFYVISVSK